MTTKNLTAVQRKVLKLAYTYAPVPAAMLDRQLRASARNLVDRGLLKYTTWTTGKRKQRAYSVTAAGSRALAER